MIEGCAQANISNKDFEGWEWVPYTLHGFDTRSIEDPHEGSQVHPRVPQKRNEHRSS